MKVSLQMKDPELRKIENRVYDGEKMVKIKPGVNGFSGPEAAKLLNSNHVEAVEMPEEAPAPPKTAKPKAAAKAKAPETKTDAPSDDEAADDTEDVAETEAPEDDAPAPTGAE